MRKGRPEPIPPILNAFAEKLGTEVKKRTVLIPKKYGHGYCKGFVFGEHIRMLISNYELRDELLIKNPEVNALGRMLFFKFQNIIPLSEDVSAEKISKAIPAVTIATSRLNTDEIISVHSNLATINIEVNADYLNKNFELPNKSMVLRSLLENSLPLLFEQTVYPSLQKIADEMMTERVDKTFELFFMRIKAEELICRLLMELEKRDEKNIYALHGKDIQSIYRVKDKILEQLETPPMIDDLALFASMSTSKLKRLFKQIFGDSLFNYYQTFRMKEAARLLREEKLSVSQVGYQMGFENLSHFSRMFEKHIGMKPKKWSMIN